MVTKGIGFGQTPSSNTGLLYKVSSKVDYLQGVFVVPNTRLSPFVDAMGAIFRDSFALDKGVKFCGRQFQHHRVSDRKAFVYYNFLPNNFVEILVMLPAKFLDGCLRLELFQSFLTDLSSFGFRATRIDLAIDDYSKSLSVQQFRDAKAAGCNHGYQKHRTIIGDSFDVGFTHYMGTVDSDKLYYFYDKAFESVGEVDANRLEGRFRDGWAKSIFSCLLSSVNEIEFHQNIINCVFKGIDFYLLNDDRTKTLLSWWQDFKDMCLAGQAVISSGQVKTSMKQTIEWFEKQVVGSLANIEKFMDRVGDDFCSWLMTAIESGRTKLTYEHQNKIDSALVVLGIPHHLSGQDVRDGYFA